MPATDPRVAILSWAERERFQVRFIPVRDAVRAARESGEDPTRPALCLADVADNPGGGGRGNTLEILEALLEADVQGALVAMFIDPALAARCHELGEGAEFRAHFQGSGRLLEHRIRVIGLAAGPLVGRRGIYRGQQHPFQQLPRPVYPLDPDVRILEKIT